MKSSVQTKIPFSDLDQTIVRCKEIVPGLKIKFKDKHWFWKRMPSPLRNSATTLGETIWLRSYRWTRRCPNAAIQTMWHEMAHVLDFKSTPWVYLLAYSFVQIMFVPFFIWSTILFMSGDIFPAIWNVFLSVFCLAPWPSSTRARLEMQGYAVGMAVQYYRHGRVTQGMRDYIRKALMGRLYYLMVWRREEADKMIADAEKQIYEPLFYADSPAMREVRKLFSK